MSEGGSPDVSKIVNLILQNPGIIEEISTLVKKDSIENSAQNDEEHIIESSSSQSIEIPAAVPIHTPSPQKSNRSQLLCAFKPYVSEQRAKAIDSMISIAEILELMKSR